MQGECILPRSLPTPNSCVCGLPSLFPLLVQPNVLLFFTGYLLVQNNEEAMSWDLWTDCLMENCKNGSAFSFAFHNFQS